MHNITNGFVIYDIYKEKQVLGDNHIEYYGSNMTS